MVIEIIMTLGIQTSIVRVVMSYKNKTKLNRKLSRSKIHFQRNKC